MNKLSTSLQTPLRGANCKQAKCFWKIAGWVHCLGQLLLRIDDETHDDESTTFRKERTIPVPAADNWPDGTATTTKVPPKRLRLVRYTSFRQDSTPPPVDPASPGPLTPSPSPVFRPTPFTQPMYRPFWLDKSFIYFAPLQLSHETRAAS